MTTKNSAAAVKSVSSRRSKFLASVAAFGVVALVAGAGLGPNFSSIVSARPAHAAEATQPSMGFADLVAKVKPAVVSVRVKMDPVEQASANGDEKDMASPVQPGPPMEKFFQQFERRDGSRRRTVTGEGSGFFISADGYAVTNNHVVDHAKSVQVTTDDGQIYSAKVVGTDPTTDLALIKVDGKSDFAYVQFADQAPRIGEWVVAVGNPFGLGGTVTAGIVSASGRAINSGPYDYIQIDAPINKGNSGGPAFDVNGKVIGVNTAIFSPSGGSVGIGFDVPAQTAKVVIAQLKDQGHVTRGWMGVQIQSVTPAIADSLGLKQARGAIVDEPQSGSPAAKAGIKSGDIITAINGTKVKDSRDVARKVAVLAPGTSVKFDILRSGQPETVTLTLGERPNQQQASADTEQQENPTSGVPHMGLSLAPADQVAGSVNKGVIVTGVDPGGPAADRGFRTGDVIIDVGGKSVATVSDVRKALADANAQGKHDVLMRVKSADTTKFIALPLSNG